MNNLNKPSTSHNGANRESSNLTSQVVYNSEECVSTDIQKDTNTQSGEFVQNEKHDEMILIYTFLVSLTRNVLRNIGRNWSRRSSGNKLELVYRN